MVEANQRNEVLKEDHEEKASNQFFTPVEVNKSAQYHDVCSEHKRHDVILTCFSESRENGLDKQIRQYKHLQENECDLDVLNPRV